MVKVRSLDHTRFVITGTGTTSKARTLYYAGDFGKIRDASAKWSTDLGGAEVFTNLHDAQKMKKAFEDYLDRGAAYLQGTVKFKVELVDRKEIMVARLKYNPEEI